MIISGWGHFLLLLPSPPYKLCLPCFLSAAKVWMPCLLSFMIYQAQSWKGSFTRQSYMENGSYGRFTNSLIWTNFELRATKCSCQTGWKSRSASAKLHNTVKYCCWPVRDGTDTTTSIPPNIIWAVQKYEIEKWKNVVDAFPKWDVYLKLNYSNWISQISTILFVKQRYIYTF